MSRTDPPIQNIPLRTSLGREIRKAFVAATPPALADVDFAGVEARIAASLTVAEADAISPLATDWAGKRLRRRPGRRGL